MKTRLSLCLVFCVVLTGCSANVPGTSGNKAGGDPSAGTTPPLRRNPVPPGFSAIDTAEIVRILENEQIASTFTGHTPQTISIILTDGRKFFGTYVHEEAGKYSEDKNLADIYSLVVHIKNNRPPEEVKGWGDDRE